MLKYYKMIKEKLEIILNKFFKNKKLENKKKKILISILIFLWLFNIYLLIQNFNLENRLKIKNVKNKQIKIDRKYFWDNLNLKNYSETKYKIQEPWKKIIENIRNVHKSPILISTEFQDKELCAWYISELSKKIWWKKVIYSIWMQNLKKAKPAKAWELPYYYDVFGWEVLIDLWEKFNLEKKDYLEKISVWDLKEFFSKAFLEKALFWDIWFLYSKTKYTRFLINWSYNSHITKNMWVSNFEIIISKFDKNKSSLSNFLANLWCNSNFKKYLNLFENYKFYLNSKQIIFYNNDFYYLENWNILW